MSEEIAQLRRYLNDIPELVAEASHYLVPGTAPVDPTLVRSAAIFRIPIATEIFDLLNERDKALDDVMLNRSNGERRLGVLPTLGLWVSLVWAELDDMGLAPRECCPPRAHTVVGEAAWLNEYVQPILELHPEFYREIELLWIELRKACRVRREYVPRCPDHGGVNRIEGVYAESLDSEGPPAWWRCKGCGRTWVHDAEIRRLALTQPKMTLRQISAIINIPLRTLHRWKNGGRFSGGPLYELDHVKRAAEKVGKEISEASA